MKDFLQRYARQSHKFGAAKTILAIDDADKSPREHGERTFIRPLRSSGLTDKGNLVRGAACVGDEGSGPPVESEVRA